MNNTKEVGKLNVDNKVMETIVDSVTDKVEKPWRSEKFPTALTDIFNELGKNSPTEIRMHNAAKNRVLSNLKRKTSKKMRVARNKYAH
jgi:hypothetical protein